MRGNSSWDDQQLERLRKRVNTERRPQPFGRVNKSIPINDSSNALNPAQKPQQKLPILMKVAPILKSSQNFVKKIKLTKQQKKVAVGLTSVFIVTGAALISSRLMSQPKTEESKDVLSETITEPEFDTVLPDGKKEETEGGKLGYDSEKKVASFADTIGTASITVSQQELPLPFKESPDDQVRMLAEGFSATTVINESNPKAYLGNDVSGAQTVIFHKNGLLIFMLSNKPVEKDQWAEYITKLL